MKPALYYPWVYLKGGAERMILELLRGSHHDWTLYTNHFAPDDTFPELSDFRVVQLGRISVRRTVLRVGEGAVRLLIQSLDLRQHDSLIVVSEGLGNLVALRSTVPTSAICLTPLKIAYDPVTRERFFRMSRKDHYRLPIRLFTMLDRGAWARYQRVFVSSQEVRDRLIRAGLVPPERVEVAHHGVDTGRFLPTGEREPFFLVPGRMMWAKNVELAIHAWREFKPAASLDQFRLVIAGMVDAKSIPYVAHLRSMARDREDIHFVESPSDAELIRLYQTCHAVMFTPPNEDWGLVPLEAMACGKPVLATDRGGPRESILDGVTGFLRADEPGVFAAGLRELAEMPDWRLDEMAVAGRARVAEFRWDAFVKRIDAHVEESLVAGPGARVESTTQARPV
jgi:glycosyltransferase involved in cell wall biosynthesis